MGWDDVGHLAYGCVFLALNPVVALVPAWLLAKRFRGHTGAVVAGLLVGGVGSFALGGVWFVLLPELGSPPPPPEYRRWGWFLLTGFFSVCYAVAGGVAVAGVAALASWWRRRRARHAEPGAVADRPRN
jgi:hypothetical protein